MVLEKELKILKLLENYKDNTIIPHYFYNENKEKLCFSRATFYRKLETLKQLKLVIFKRNKLKITNKGLLLLKLFNNNENIKELEKEEFKELEEEEGLKNNDKLKNEFVIVEQSELKNLKNNNNFIYINYPSTTYILKLILKYFNIDSRGLSTNAEKLNFILNCHDIKDVNLAIDYFENASKQAIIALRELILAGKVNKIYISFKDIKKALKKKEILNFLQEFEFELKNTTEKLEKLEKDEVNLFNVFLLFIISTVVILSYRMNFQYAYAVALLLILYFARYLFIKNIRDEI